jgi:hypothetical protein
MEVNKRLARDAKKKGICEEWYGRLIDTKGKDELIKMYLEGIDFCLSNEYPSNEFIRQHFVGTCEAYGVFLDHRTSYYGRKLPARSSPWPLRGYRHLRRLERRAGIRKAPKPVKGSCYR